MAVRLIQNDAGQEELRPYQTLLSNLFHDTIYIIYINHIVFVFNPDEKEIMNSKMM